jgi:signal peptidase I
MNSPSIPETLANLSISIIVMFVVGATLLRLGLIRVPNGAARSAAELLESAIIAVVLVFLVIRPFVVQAYFIPSPSMEPTLLGKNGVGDRILVNKLIYRLQQPKHDDVVVFIPPPSATEGSSEDPTGNPINFIKRLIGEPGDVIEAHAGRLMVNGQPFSHARIRQMLSIAGVFGDDTALTDDTQADHHVKFIDGAVLVDDKPFPLSRLAQILTGDPNAKITVIPGYTTRNGKKLNEPFTAEDPDYDLKLYHGQPLKYDQSTDGHPYRGAGRSGPVEHVLHDGRQPQRQPRQHRMGAARQEASRRQGGVHLLAPQPHRPDCGLGRGIEAVRSGPSGAGCLGRQTAPPAGGTAGSNRRSLAL